jgi:hypothetical protein
MSKFKTTIPVDVAGLIQILPKGSSIGPVTLRKDNSAVDVEWEHDDYVTPYTFAVECADPTMLAKKPEIRSQKSAPVSGHEAASPLPEEAPLAEARSVKKKKNS